MKNLLTRLERYLERKRLELNMEKIKMMRLRKKEKKKENRLDVEKKKIRGSEKV